MSLTCGFAWLDVEVGMMASMADVARRANVAVSTVSYALNGTRPVAKATAERIHRAMEELGYRPNALARGLASKRSRNIALIFPMLERGLGLTEMEFVSAAAETAGELGYHLVLWSTPLGDTDLLTRLTRQGLVDGVVIMEVHLDDARIEMLRRTGVPFCMIGRTGENREDPFADIDFESTIRDAVAHLAGLGHRTVGFINHSRASFDAGYGPSVRAARAFEEAARDSGLRHFSRFCDDSPTAGREMWPEIVAAQPGVTGVIVMNERAGAGVLAAILRSGARVPEDFSVLSVASSERVAEMTYPPLTTFHPPAAELGRLGVQVLIDRLEGGEVPLVQQLIPCRLVLRDSTGPATRQPGAGI
ncbi:LacI family DNA-binding transcriptional regulator [Catenuloplanes atrovinosus]|uniref:DNA-binding LacI/PurR family transcriptional regulator n=1 Tax=Catenuloplanes atrovinosus TaxID=137266 RepID=A0AAE4C8F8_9ACTN|nr:LacI family DNA-binding transcriptional regulator [Catenuloplanes atrovinosus]MDR7273749.1 DNA-binding LacI/PurR family transcriptional regulator [Catenuloplanes atrovinosus]